MPRRNQELLDLHHAGLLNPGECDVCDQDNWNPGYDRGDDPHYLGFQCRGCGHIIGRGREDVAYDAQLTQDSTRAELNNVFVGRTVVKVDDDRLRLDDGTELLIVPAEHSCCSGYDITELNGCDNIITGAKVVEEEVTNEYRTDPRLFRLFVFSGHRKVNLLTVDGQDGSGQYGTGFVIYVKAPRE